MTNLDPDNKIEVYDQLIEGLADRASDSETESKEFFAKLSQVIESILDPEWLAVVASGKVASGKDGSGKDGSPLVVHQTPGGQLGLRSVFSKRASSIQSSAGLLVSDIEPTAGQGRWGYLLVQLKSDTSTLVQQNVANAIAESVTEFVRRQVLNSADESYQEDLLRFSINAHSSLDQREVGHHLANDTRLLLGCERVSVFAIKNRKPKLLAISSVASIEKRSQLIRNLNAMVLRAVQVNEPILSDQKSNDLRLEKLLDTHCHESQFPFVFGIPVFAPKAASSAKKSEPVGFLVAESTEDIDRLKFGRGISQVGPHAATSLNNAKRFNQIPFRGTLSWLGRMASVFNFSIMGIVAGLIALSTLALMLIQTDFKVRIPGELKPVVERTIFSPQDGVVSEVFVNHGDVVKIEDPLIQLRSADMEMELEKVRSEIKKLEQLMDSKQIALNQVTNSGDGALAAQFASEVSDLNFQIATAQEKGSFLTKKMAKLRVVCPIEGQVTTWQAKENLANRPVRWGDPMLRIARLDGEWNVVFKVPERRIGYILDRQNASDEPVELEFFLNSNPSHKYQVTVVSIDASAVQDRELGTVTLVRCKAPAELLTKRQGAVVSGDVDCGKRSVWFVWTREMFDSIRRRFVL